MIFESTQHIVGNLSLICIGVFVLSITGLCAIDAKDIKKYENLNFIRL